eukprot:COSAG02_NODE_42686_length_382_cov_0.756184_1_plen_63_part_01
MVSPLTCQAACAASSGCDFFSFEYLYLPPLSHAQACLYTPQPSFCTRDQFVRMCYLKTGFVDN